MDVYPGFSTLVLKIEGSLGKFVFAGFPCYLCSENLIVKPQKNKSYGIIKVQKSISVILDFLPLYG